MSSIIPNAQPDKHNFKSCHEVSSAQQDHQEITTISDSPELTDHQPEDFQPQSSVFKSQESQENPNSSTMPALGGSPSVTESTPLETSRPVQVGDLCSSTELILSPTKQNTSVSKEVSFKKKIIFNTSSSELEEASAGIKVEPSKVSGTEADTEDSERDKKEEENDPMDDSDIQILSPQLKTFDKTINLEDSDASINNSFRLEISDTESPLTKNTFSLSSGSIQKGLEESISPKDKQDSLLMSQVLVPDNLLCQDVNAIEDDQDMKEVSEILDNVVDEVADADTEPSNDLNDSLYVVEEEKGTKRTAKEAALSSADESIRKKSDFKGELPKNLVSSSGSAKLTPTPTDSNGRLSQYTKLTEKSSASHLGDDELTSSRPGSSHALQSPDISCSPIVGGEDHEKGKRKTSTPGEGQGGGKGLSSPQKQLRKRIQERELEPSSDDDTSLAQRKERKKGKKKDDPVAKFKEPSPISSPEQSIRLKLDAISSDAYLTDLAHKLGLPPGFSLGIFVQGPSPVPDDVKTRASSLPGFSTTTVPVPRVQKRVSDISLLSSNSGGSSGYLGSASSGVSESSGGSGPSGRSRLSIMPEMRVEKHRVVGPLPKRADSISTQDSMAAQAGSQASSVVNGRTEVHFVSDTQMQDNTIHSQANVEDLTTIQEEDEPVAGPSGKKKRKSPVGKGKVEGTPSKNKKLSRKKRKTSTSSTPRKEREESEGSDGVDVQEKIPVPAEMLKEPEHGLGVGSRVFARWVDGTGVYFYSAVVVAIEENKAKVMFLQDRVEKWVNAEGECILVTQLSPGDQVTVQHDTYEAYEVTATLITFPSRDADGEVQYELAITAKEGEPGYNEDSRTVHHREAYLTDQQANVALTHLGRPGTSNRVSADLNFGNLLFGKRKSRPLDSPVTTPVKSTPGKKATPRRKRGGDNVEDSQHTYTESSAAEMAAPTTPRRKYRPKVSMVSTTEDEAPSPRTIRKSRVSSDTTEDIFLGMSFVLTQSVVADNSEDNQDTDTDVPPFDKAGIRAGIVAGGGKILAEFPTQHGPAPTADTEMIVISDRACRTMTYLLALANSTPLVNFQFVLDSSRAGKRLDYKHYLLPAGQSELLQMELEQGENYRKDLEASGCIQPMPPATSTRHRGSRGDADDTPARKKILSGLHVLVLSKDKLFTEDWQSVLDAIGARVTKRTNASARLTQIRAPDLVVCDATAPAAIVKDLLSKPEIPILGTKWIIECVLTNARVAYNNFIQDLPTK